jgi:hypothetical protein
MSATRATLLLDVLAWDLVADLNGDIAMATPPYAVAQDAASECKLFRGEAYYDTTRGVPYWGQILGLAPPLSLVRAYYMVAAELVPGVVSVTVVFTSFVHRLLKGQVQVKDVDGNISAAGF